MSAQEALVERTKKATQASKKQARTYAGANDYWYEKMRRQGGVMHGVPGRLSKLSKTGVQDIRRFIGTYAPSRVRQTLQEHIDAAREQQKDFAVRGEAIAADWKQATPVKDANALIGAVRSSKGPAEIVKSVRSWMTDYPADATASARPAPAAEPAKAHPAAH